MQVGRISQLDNGAKALESTGNEMVAPFVVAHLRDVLEQIVKAVDNAAGDKIIRDLAATAAAEVTAGEFAADVTGTDGMVKHGAVLKLFPGETLPNYDFRDEVLDAMRGSIPQEPNLHPINLLKDFIRDLQRADVVALVAAEDPDAHYDLLADVKLMQEQLAAINAAEPLPPRD